MKEYGHFLSEEDKLMVNTIRDFVNKELMPVRQQLDEDEDRDLVHHILDGLAKLGLHKRGLPESVGGLRTTAVSLEVGYEEVARGDSGIAMTLSIPAWVFGPAMRAHNERVINDLCPPFCREDEFHEACQAMTEPEGGCNIEDASSRGKTIQTTARLDGEEWVINGAKRFPSGASVADVYLVTCTTNPELGEEGIALIYVPAGTPGLSFGRPENKMGMRYTDVNTDIYLDNVRVPQEYRAGWPGKDFESFRNFLSWGRLSSAAFAVGNAQAALEIVLDFTANRFYGGKPVREHSLQAAMIADMAIGVESARFYYLTVARMFDNRKVFGPPHSEFQLSKATGAKIHACDVAVEVCNKGMQLMGSYGYMKEYNLEKYLRDCKIIQLWEGGAELGRIDVARGYYPIRAYT